MKITENECVDCGLPCRYETCRYYRVTRYYCDECDDETELFYFDGKELCINCIKELLPQVEGSYY